MPKGIVRDVLVALLLAVVVGLVLSLFEATDQVAAGAALLTFVAVLLLSVLGRGDGRVT